MKYCVKKNTSLVIDGGENSKENMLKNATNCGFNKDEVEIITEEEYKKRLEKNEMKVVREPTEQEKLNAQLLRQNAEIHIQLEEQKTFNAQILLKLAGGNSDV